jgi:GDSL-like lipase/acylhydrolase family protein
MIVFLVCFGTGAGLLIAEGVLRVFKLWVIVDYAQMNWYRRVPIAGVPYLLKPNLHAAWGLGRVATDEFGLRNEHPTEKPAGIYRILMLGDSVTFGYGVDQTQSFPAVLEGLLNENSKTKYQVINAGIPGYSIRDEGALLPALLARYKPDLVLWTVTSNDYDDSFGIDDAGRIVFSNVDFVVNAGHIAAWGHDGRPYIDVDDFRRSMLPPSVAWSEGKIQPKSLRSTWDSWLSSHVFVYSFFRTRIPALPKVPAPLKPTEAELLGRYTAADGRKFFLQFFSPVYSSRHAIGRANRVLEQSRSLSEQSHVPIFLISAGLPLDQRWMNSNEHIIYQDLSDYLGESYVDFFLDNGLGWDSHPSPSGNRKIAQALRRLLGCRGYTPSKNGCDAAEATGAEMRKYWSLFQFRRREFMQQYYGPVDLDRFRGVHQILGGIFPPRVFPGEFARRANVLIPVGPGKSLVIAGSLAGKDNMNVRVTVFAEERSVVQDVLLKPGEVAIALDLRSFLNAVQHLEEPVEVQLECVSDACPSLRLHRISLG